MGKIVLLDELTINQIAAGEVIERPASVIKEMVENSIDAGAKHIVVEIKNGGISYIRVSDDGKGIARDDVEMAFERHATSKIRSAADLSEVKSMGFRGEALASVAAIANVELISRTEEESVGTKIVVEGGNVLNIEEIGASKGTVITVRNLFFNTPVRYKFLKKDFTETGYIEDVIERIALVHPEIAIKLINTGKTVVQTNGNGDLKSVIYSIFGKDIAEKVLPVDYEYEYIKVKGVIGKPEIARSNRSNQMFFVNSRYVKDKTLTSAAEQGFKGMIPLGKFAFLVLNLEMTPSKVDVNVHPAKLEVRFEEESIVFKAVYHAIKNTLLSENIISDKEKNQEIKEAARDAFKIQATQIFDSSKANDILTTRPSVTKVNNVENNVLEDKNDILSSNIDVFEKLKRMQEELKYEVETNPKLKLDEEYKIKEKAFNEISQKNQDTRKIEIKQEEIKKEEVKEEVKQEEPKQESSAEKIQATQKIEIVNEVEQEHETEKENIIKEQQIKEQPKAEHIENEQVTPKIEIVQEEQKQEISENDENTKETSQDLSFEEMYKKLFGKEPYGGRKQEETKQEEKENNQDIYTIGDEDLSDNISVFEDMEEYNKPTYRFIGVTFKSYIIIEMNNEILIVSGQAAHERIMYEKVKANFYREGSKDSQMLLLPDIINLTPKEMDIAKDNFGLFEKAGFVVEEFGENTIKLSGVPEICIDLDTKELFMETLDEINTVARTAKQEKEEKFIWAVARKAAVKANMDLTAEEATSLIDELLSLPNPFVSAFGVPIVIKMSKYDIERKFARK